MGELAKPTSGPDDASLDAWRAYALVYLAEAIRESAPNALGSATIFPHSPLEGEGAVVVFEFEAERSSLDAKRFFVVVGKTEANYYPGYDLTSDEAFSLHLGTRFMLVMGIGQAPPEQLATFDAAVAAKAVVNRISPELTVVDARVAAAFDVDGELHAIVSCRIGGRDVYVMAGDAPPGIHERVALPPQVVYRMHVGQVLRNEPDPDGPRRDTSYP
ncbi:MAG: hypothetical protein HZA51_08120 [Planctomycetes bacterium]|nr:hypothetical protein [Planctomycetota bacterium]